MSRWTLLAALLISSCAEPPRPSGAPDAGGNSLARLEVIVTAPREGEVKIETAARFYRWRDLDPASAAVLAGGAAEPTELDGGARCAVVDTETALSDALATTPPDAALVMLDAGEMLVRAAGQAVRLVPQVMPEILPFVSGVRYEVDGPGSEAAPAPMDSAEVFVSAFGGEDVSRFDATLDIPAIPHIASVTPAADGAIDVTWAAGRDPEVTLVVSAARGLELRCRSADTGFARIPGSALHQITEAARGIATPEMTVAVERSVRAPFTAGGIDAGELVVTVRGVAPLR